jgi:predicted ester cyclase
MSEQANKERLRELLAAADSGDIDHLLTFYAPNYFDHDASVARAGTDHRSALGLAFPRFQAAFSDTRHIIEDLIAEGDKVVARIAVETRHTGPYNGIPATGQMLRNDSIVIYRFENGQIRERWCRERHSTQELLEAAANGRVP